MITTLSHGRPPEQEYREAVDALGPRSPGHIHYFLGAGAASYAIILIALAGFAVTPLPAVVCLLAIVSGMIGGWFIREAADRRFYSEVIQEAWARYHGRRQREFRTLRA